MDVEFGEHFVNRLVVVGEHWVVEVGWPWIGLVVEVGGHWVGLVVEVGGHWVGKDAEVDVVDEVLEHWVAAVEVTTESSGGDDEGSA